MVFEWYLFVRVRANIPSVVPLPCLNSSCSSPISPYTTALILPSRFLSSNANIWFSNVVPLFLTGHAHLPFFSIFGQTAPFFLHFYSHFINAWLSFQIDVRAYVLACVRVCVRVRVCMCVAESLYNS